ncbi:hypothetical protein ABI59_09900 [Acidobacteria bacterium Mor1]|nr:hypothetical protein ABI59_09900 [Acidobacteria bacterium Mor1]
MAPAVAAGPAGPTAFDRWVDDLWALEEVYWQNRIWPKANPGPKPELSQVLDRSAVKARALDTLTALGELEAAHGFRIDGHRLQIELDRLAADTRAPRTLEQLFAALDHDPERLSRTLALTAYVQRLRDQLDAANGAGLGLAPRPDNPTEHPILSDGLNVTLPPVTGEDGTVGFSSGSGCTDDTWASLTVEPSPRGLHSAVWTGSEMIVWGGGNGNELYDNGGRYDPATDTWTPVTLTGAPDGRERHTAVWTGTEMIVWGGGIFEGLDTGGRYNPSTDSWAATTTSGAPDGRTGHVAVWSGSEMIVWGGEDFPEAGGRYDPSTDSWTLMPPFAGPDVRPHAVAVWTGGQMLIMGGGIEDGTDLFDIYNDIWRYTPGSNSWSSSASLPGPRRTRHAGVWTGSELLVWGGQGLEWDPENEEYLTIELDDGWRFNPGTGSWSAMGTNGIVPLPRYLHTAVWTGSEMIIYGGSGGFDASAYNPSSNFWSFVPSNGQGSELTEHTAVWTGSEMITWGGQTSSAGLMSRGSRFDPGPDSWTPTFSSNPPQPREEHVAVWTGSEMIVHGGRGPEELITYRYDPALNIWNQAAPSGLTQRLRLHTAVWSGSEMIVWGGLMGFSTEMDDGGRYNPTSDSWSPADQTGAPAPRYRHLAGWTGTEMLVYDGHLADNNGGLYDPVADSWRSMTTLNAPPSSQTATGVAADGEFIVWGGSSTNIGARYDWTADTWTPTTTTGAPAERSNHTAVWTGSEMLVWGGASAASPNGLDDGGRYDPATDSWTPMSISGPPAARFGHIAVWSGNEMLVWGGSINSNYPDDGGRYDPATDSWQIMSLEQAPIGREEHTGVWSGSELIVFGGFRLNRPPIGGRYCSAASCTATDWFRDADDDGFGDSGDVVSACTAPAGYVGTSGDCDDGDGDAWATPSETLDLLLSHDQVGGVTSLSWSAPADPGASILTYDVLRSSDAGDFNGAGVCFESGDSDLVATDASDPAGGAVFFYLSRATNTCPQGDGDLGTDSQSAPRSGAACP